MQALKLAKDLVPGDCIHTTFTTHVVESATVLAVVPSVQVVRRKVVLITLRDTNGREVHRTCNENATIKMVPEGD